MTMKRKVESQQHPECETSGNMNVSSASSCLPAIVSDLYVTNAGLKYVAVRTYSDKAPQYFSGTLPFVIPRMVSGLDFREESTAWCRHKFPEAPKVPMQRWVRGFARRSESACRTSWDALPTVMKKTPMPTSS